MALSAHTIKSFGQALLDVDAAKELETSISTLDTSSSTYATSFSTHAGSISTQAGSISAQATSINSPPTQAQSSNTTVIATTQFVNKIVYSTGEYYASAGGM